MAKCVYFRTKNANYRLLHHAQMDYTFPSDSTRHEMSLIMPIPTGLWDFVEVDVCGLVIF